VCSVSVFITHFAAFSKGFDIIAGTATTNRKSFFVSGGDKDTSKTTTNTMAGNSTGNNTHDASTTAMTDGAGNGSGSVATKKRMQTTMPVAASIGM
jgi:hypothetical protein